MYVDTPLLSTAVDARELLDADASLELPGTLDGFGGGGSSEPLDPKEKFTRIFDINFFKLRHYKQSI